MFGLAANDGEVERLIKAFLIPVTLKMNSEFKPVQDKVLTLFCMSCNIEVGGN